MLILDLHCKVLVQDFLVRDDIDESILLIQLCNYHYNHLRNTQTFVANIRETRRFVCCYERAIVESIAQNLVHVMNEP